MKVLNSFMSKIAINLFITMIVFITMILFITMIVGYILSQCLIDPKVLSQDIYVTLLQRLFN